MSRRISDDLTWYVHHTGIELTATRQAGIAVQRLVLLNLCAHANHAGVAYPGQLTVAKALQLARQSVQDSMKALEAQGLIRRMSEKKKGAVVKWLVLPDVIDSLSAETETDNSQHDGVSRQVEPEHARQHARQHDGGHDGTPRHEVEVEVKYHQQKFSNNVSPGSNRETRGAKNERKELNPVMAQVMDIAVAKHFRTRPTTAPPGAPLRRQKNDAAQGYANELLSEARRSITDPGLDIALLAQCVAQKLAGERVLHKDILQLQGLDIFHTAG
jgi:DNA-binding transcriptional MocR family regulator